jgi:sugar phosphate isomerase/epimerase
MFKNLNPLAIGVSGRQSELIELALTYGFKGIEIDMADLVKRSQRATFEKAARFLTSAAASSKLKIGGFETPIDLDDDDQTYATKLAGLPEAAQTAGRVSANTALLRIPAGTDRLPYHEYFNVVRKRIDEIAQVFATSNINVALNFSASSDAATGKQFKFVNDVEGFLALFRACTAKNVGVTVDTWSFHVGGGTYDQLSELPADRVFSLRVADISDKVELKKATTKNRLMPGIGGVIDNVQIVGHFAKAGYKGPITPMGHSNNSSGMTRDSLVSAAQDAIDKVLTEAGVPTQTRKPEMFVESSYSLGPMG